MKALVIDIETADVFNAEKRTPQDLELTVVGVFNYSENTYTTYTQETLSDLWEVLRSITTFIGFNSNHFDIPLLNKYAPLDLTKEYKSIDLLESVRTSLGRRIRLDWIAEGTLGIQKSGDGLQAVKWWSEGEVEKVKAYCLDDVKITKDIFDYALKNEKLHFKDMGTLHTIPIDTSEWQVTMRPKEASIGLF